MLTASQLVAAAEPRSTEDLENAFRDLLQQGLTQSHALDVLHEIGAAELDGVSARDAIWRAVESHCVHSEDDREIDGNALFSQTEEGLWVSAWVWVDNKTLGIKEPLPEDLHGKLWLVSESVLNIPRSERVCMPFGEFSVTQIETWEDAAEAYDRLRLHDFIALADTREAATEIANAEDAEERDAKHAFNEDLSFGYYIMPAVAAVEAPQ